MSTSIDPDVASPWHAGEVELQRHIGVADYVREHGSAWVRSHLIEQHRTFYPLLPFIAIGAVDLAGNVWATLRAGPPGFLQSPDELQLDIAAPRDASDPAEAGMEDGDAVGLLGIDLVTRRRNRLNGTVRRSGPASFAVAVGQSYGNCPRYIQNRHFAFSRDPAQPSPLPALRLDAMDARARRMVHEADTFFVSSYVDLADGERQVDVSHRGGRPGFVRVETRGHEDVLTVPDFNGNLLFNTLGNFMSNPKAGLLFVDHASGEVLQMTGRAEVVLDSAEIAAFEGAERLWRFIPSQVVHRHQGLPLRWTFAEDGWSPNLRMTGDWVEAGQRLEAAALASRWRLFKIAAITEESSSVRSLRLEPADGLALLPHRAGQHLPIRLATAGQGATLVRTYTLSSAPSDGHYRISIKKQGAASSHLHAAHVGDTLEVQGPAGSFTIDARERRPVVLLAAGIGITPLLAMLRHLVHEGLRTRYRRAVWLFYSARNKEDRAFDSELQQLVASSQGSVHLVRVLGTPEASSTAADFDVAGRIDLALLKARLPFDDYDFYLCGPDGFMQANYDGLKSLNVAEARIHAEAFGPSALKRAGGTTKAELPPIAESTVRVVFAASGKEARWKPGDGDLLTLAESRGIAPAFGCRGGHCGTCKTKVLQGAVTYAEQPVYAVEAGEVLLCQGLPAQASGEALHLQA
jgi:ferredoxin-NADP reductase/predicted pyridoxine 5'-phosphate oxidase superfamily flavin-nucleotide-binding protein